MRLLTDYGCLHRLLLGALAINLLVLSIGDDKGAQPRLEKLFLVCPVQTQGGAAPTTNSASPLVQ